MPMDFLYKKMRLINIAYIFNIEREGATAVFIVVVFVLLCCCVLFCCFCFVLEGFLGFFVCFLVVVFLKGRAF